MQWMGIRATSQPGLSTGSNAGQEMQDPACCHQVWHLVHQDKHPPVHTRDGPHSPLALKESWPIAVNLRLEDGEEENKATLTPLAVDSSLNRAPL